MTAEIVNLRQFRKGKARQEKASQADQNRVSFGLSKPEKQLARSLNDKAQKTLDQGKLEKPFRDKD